MIERALVDLIEGWQCEWKVEVKILVSCGPVVPEYRSHLEVLEER